MSVEGGLNGFKKLFSSHWFWHIVAIIAVITLGAVCIGGNFQYSRSIGRLEFNLEQANRELGDANTELNRRANERQEFYGQFKQGLGAIKSNLSTVSTGITDFTSRLRKVSETVKQMEDTLDSFGRNDSN